MPYNINTFIPSLPVRATQVCLLTSDCKVNCRPLEPS